MDYTDQQLKAAWYADEVARYNLLLGQPQRPESAGLALARGEVAEPVSLDDISPGDLEDAVSELSARRGETYAETWDEVRLAAEGERDTVSLTGALVELAQLGAWKRNDLPDEALAHIEPGGTKDSEGKTVPRSLRHFPIHDRAHVVNALARISQGAEFGKEALPKVKAAAKKHGIEVEGDEEEEEKGGTSVAAARRARAVLPPGVVSLSADGYDELELSDQEVTGGPLEEIQQRHPDLFAKPGATQHAFKPARPGPVTTRSRAHRPDEEDTSDRRQPGRGGAVHPEVGRYLDELARMHQGGFGGAEKPHGSVVTHRRAS